MAEVVVFPDVEDLTRLHLQAEPLLAGVSVYAGQLPATWPAELVLVRRTGGPSRDMVTDLAQVTIESRAKTAGRAQRIAAIVRAVLKAAALDGALDGVPLYEVRDLSGPYADPDPNHPTVPRYSATYQLAVRGAAA